MTPVHEAARLNLVGHVPVTTDNDLISGCTCGWSKPGGSFAGHLVSMLAAAELLRPHPVPERVGARLRLWHEAEVVRERFPVTALPLNDDYWAGMGVAAISACGLGGVP